MELNRLHHLVQWGLDKRQCVSQSDIVAPTWYVFYKVAYAYHYNIIRTYWRVKSPALTLFVFCSDIYPRKHQISVLLIPIEENPRVPRGFISQRASSTWNVSVLWHYNGARPVTSPGIVEIGQRRVCVNFNRSGIVAPTWHQWNGHLCFDMAIKTTHNTAVHILHL